MSEPSGTDARLDRIEELMQDNKQLKNSLMLISVAWDQALRQRDAAEAKLTKAVEMALEECPFRKGTGSYNDWWHIRKTTLTKLEGK